MVLIADDARMPSSGGIIIMIERHKALLVVGDGEESHIYLSRQVIKKLKVIDSGDICRGRLVTAIVHIQELSG